MSTYKFSINVVARHHTRRAEEIASGLEWEPHNAWSVGDSRVTPAGTPLPGTRQDTMCSFRFEHDDDQLTAAVTRAVEQLRSHRRFVSELLGSGGTLALNIGFNGQFNSALDLSRETLRSICDLGIGISVECFPDG
ncbi:MAG TPA: hypothetical protein VF169_18925 [Albitalea sp.]|uniref:hypothetical protein n=1 Tax=Piscinibacter sp. TaxID=1903157 RepID=UPI002ED208E2